MKNALNSIVLKIAAVIVSFFVFATMIFSVLGVFVMLFNDFYTSDFKDCESTVMGNLAKQELYKLEQIYDSSPSDYYADKNVYYEIEYFKTGDIQTNRNSNQPYIAMATATVTESEYIDIDGNMHIVEDVNTFSDGEYNGDGEYKNVNEIRLTVYIPSQMKYTDRFWLADKAVTFGYDNRYILIFVSVLSFVVTIAVFSYIFAFVGHGKNKDGISVCVFNNIPADIHTVITLIAGGLCISTLEGLHTLSDALFFVPIIFILLYFICLWYAMSVVAQIKAKHLLKHTVLYKIFKLLSKVGGLIRHIFKNLATVYKVAIVIAAVFIFELIVAVNCYETDNLIIFFMTVNIITAIVLLLSAISFQKVKQGGEEIVSGNLENKIDTKYMYGDIKEFGESLNNINSGLQVAINDKVKSERFKTELITNVSHDIKTPLTSIVNYVDLIKKEDCENENINRYIDVLDRQSKRLKKLIEDLVEASKASTGNLSVELSKCNISLLINQAASEYAERFELKKLQFVQFEDNRDIYILADGRRLWRVFDNLLNNIYKYAMPGTRVYIDLTCDGDYAVITFKNISELPLTVSGDELTERFVRGDRSRNTEGSGLGLSIAKSLTELQNGKFEIDTDGDLFKAIITFKIVGE